MMCFAWISRLTIAPMGVSDSLRVSDYTTIHKHGTIMVQAHFILQPNNHPHDSPGNNHPIN